MNFLKKLATPFVAIWKWIKETAWVQPLLIVGLIFGVIFSIPSITKGIQNLIDNSDDGLDYYETVQLSLRNARKGTSECDLFFEGYEKAAAYANGQTSDDSAFNAFKEKYGEKFFLVFSQSDCDYCEKVSDALEELKDGWDKKYYLSDEADYKCWSIICDQDMKSESKYYEKTRAFEYILNDHSTFFEDMMSFGTRNTYYTNLDSSSKTSLKNYVEYFLGDVGSVHVPCVVVFDLTQKATNVDEDWKYLVNSVFFDIPDQYDTNEVTRAQFLSYAWSYKHDFEIKK